MAHRVGINGLEPTSGLGQRGKCTACGVCSVEIHRVQVAGAPCTKTKENAMKHLAGLVSSLGIALAPCMLRAQDAWPARPITFVVPYGAAGYTDLVGRVAARYVEKVLGKPVI